MRKFINTLTAAIIAFSSVGCYTAIDTERTAFAYTKPTDIHLTVQTKEIKISEIPSDRKIMLDIYSENCPPFIDLSFLLEKDSRLGYISDSYLMSTDDVANMGGFGYSGGMEAIENVVSCTVSSVRNEKINHNGRLVQAVVVLPENVQAGDFYSVNILGKYSFSTCNKEAGILLENKRDAYFDSTSFSQLNGGGIRITAEPVQSGDNNNVSPYIPNEVPAVPETPVNNEPAPESQQGASGESAVNKEPASTTTTVAATSAVTAASTTVLTTSLTTTNKKQSTLSESTSVRTVTKLTSAASTSLPHTTKKEKEKKESNNTLIVIVAAAVTVSLTAALIIKKNKK